MLEHANEIAAPGSASDFDMVKVYAGLKKAAGKLGRQSQLDAKAETIVEALRLGVPSEVVYWQLRQFAQASRHDPTIATDRGRLIYIDVAPNSDQIVLYVGRKCSMAIFVGDDDRHYFALTVSERYTYKVLGDGRGMMRLCDGHEALVAELSPLGVYDYKTKPVLVYSICEHGTGRSRACLTLGAR